MFVNATLALWLFAAPAGAESLKILAFGDSLTAGYRLPANQSFPAQLERALRSDRLDVRVVNGGVSGDTSAGGLRRLDWALADKPDAVILELGANDALRGVDPAVTKANLDAILAAIRERGVPVLIAGMRAPPNMGREYVAEFDGLYAALAKKYRADLYPFFLDGVAADPILNQADGIHPTAEGIAEIVRRIMPYVKTLVARAAAR